jgi:hypothetical protein
VVVLGTPQFLFAQWRIQFEHEKEGDGINIIKAKEFS